MKNKEEIQNLYMQLEKELQRELKNPTNIRNSLLLQSKIKVIEWVLQ